MSVLTAFYDLEHGPISFDFVTWLVRAMQQRDVRKCSKLHAVIVPKEDGVGGFSRDWGGHDEAAARWRLWHIVVAAVPLAGATVTVAASREQAVRLRDSNEAAGQQNWWPVGKAHFMGPLVEAARRGEPVPKLTATAGAKRYIAAWVRFETSLPVVTLTLRNNGTDPARNSVTEAWNAFAWWLRDSGYCAVILNDTNDALKVGKGYAELDPDLRLALYEHAHMNVIGNNGPQELLKFSAAPYLVFGLGLESWREHFRKYFSMEYGQQLPWASKGQRLVYRPATFEIMKEEFDRPG